MYNQQKSNKNNKSQKDLKIKSGGLEGAKICGGTESTLKYPNSQSNFNKKLPPKIKINHRLIIK